MSVLVDFSRFIGSVLKRWQAYLTGSLFTAVAFIYEHLTKKMISGQTVIWGAAVFFITGAFMAWRQEYRSDRPIEIRDRLDVFVRRGKVLLDLWMEKRCPRIRSGSWNRSVTRFVKKHFEMPDYDHFRNRIIADDKLTVEIALKLAEPPGEEFSKAYDNAMLLATRLESLKELRRKIRD